MERGFAMRPRERRETSEQDLFRSRLAISSAQDYVSETSGTGCTAARAAELDLLPGQPASHEGAPSIRLFLLSRRIGAYRISDPSQEVPERCGSSAAPNTPVTQHAARE